MKNLTHFPVLTAVALLSTLSGCASSGGSTERTPDTVTEIAADSVQIANSTTTPADTVTTAGGDSFSTTDNTDAPMTITGSTETGRTSRGPHDNLIEVNGDASEDLGNYLRRVANVHVIGIGENARVSVRGIGPNRLQPLASWESTNPLYIVDGFKWGHNYREIFNRINVSDIKSIRVLKGPEAAMYGSEGANGVIIITQFTARDTRE